MEKWNPKIHLKTEYYMRVDDGLGEDNAGLRKARHVGGVKGRGRDLKGGWVRQPDVLRCRYQDAAADEADVLTPLEQTGEPVERGVGVRAVNVLDQG